MHYWLKITNILNSLFSTKQASFSNRRKFPSKWHLFSSQAACFVSFTNFLLTFVGQGTGVAAMMYTMSSSFHKRHNLFRRCSAGMPTCQMKMLHMGGQMGTHTLTSRPTLIQLHHGWSIIGVHNQVGLSDCSAGTYTCFGMANCSNHSHLERTNWFLPDSMFQPLFLLCSSLQDQRVHQHLVFSLCHHLNWDNKVTPQFSFWQARWSDTFQSHIAVIFFLTHWHLYRLIATYM